MPADLYFDVVDDDGDALEVFPADEDMTYLVLQIEDESVALSPDAIDRLIFGLRHMQREVTRVSAS